MALFDFVLQSAVLLAFIAPRGFQLPELWLYPLAIVTLLVFTTALTLWVSALNVRYRDVGHLLNLGLLVWFWLTPIVYQGWLVQNELASKTILGINAWTLYLLNPAVGIVLGFQTALYGVTPPAPRSAAGAPRDEPRRGHRTAPRRPRGRVRAPAAGGGPSSIVGRLRGGAVTTAIEIDGISKMFRLHRERPTSVKQRLLASRSRSEEFWALRDVTFDVPEGSSLGLIGHNGSGKTTLLKCIAGILRPTSGTIRYHGRLAGLLELGAGFHQELTGRENVYLNGSFLGLARKDIDRIYDDIVAFSELENFMDNPVKFYRRDAGPPSFAVAVHIDLEVLLIDEVLAVGDESFQRRCLDRIRRFRAEGRTIVLVTHALDQVRDVCDEAVMLDNGRVHSIGAPEDVVRVLRHRLLSDDPTFVAEEGTREVEIVGVAIESESGLRDTVHRARA